jgi:hypothetical protein
MHYLLESGMLIIEAKDLVIHMQNLSKAVLLKLVLLHWTVTPMTVNVIVRLESKFLVKILFFFPTNMRNKLFVE